MDSITQYINQGKKGWIQTLKKEELIDIANELSGKIVFTGEHTLEEVRVFLRHYIDQKKSKRKTMTSFTNLEVFSGGNWNAYEQQLECFILLNDISKEKRVPLLITKLSTNVYDLLITLCTPNSPMKESYEIICENLRKYYHPVKNSAIHQAEFRRRCQKSNETLDEYIIDLKKLSKNCNFNNLNEEIKERLLNGTYRDSVRFELLKQAELPLDQLTIIGKTVEAAYNLAFSQDKQQEHSQMFKLGERNFTRKMAAPQQNIRSEERSKQMMTCFCCGKNGHIKAECTLRNKFCSECGIKGHIFRVCNKNKQSKLKNVNIVQSDNLLIII